MIMATAQSTAAKPRVCVYETRGLEFAGDGLHRPRRLKCVAVANSLEEGSERLFTFTRLLESPIEVGPNHKCC